MALSLKVPTIFTAQDKMSSVIRKMTQGVQGFHNKLQSGVSAGNKLFRKLTPSISAAGKELLSFVSAATIAGGIFAGVNFGTQSVMDYEVALHSLEAVTGESSAKFKGQIESIAKRSKKSAIEVASSFETIGSAMSQYLDNPKALGQITEAGITLAKASRQELQPTLENLTSVMNQFKLSAEEANKTINILTAGEIVGSVSTAKIAEGLQEFGANAYNANVKLSESVALLETLGKQMDHSKIAVGARNLLSVMSSAKGLPKEAINSLKEHGVNLNVLMDKSKPLGVRLKELSKIQNDAVAVTKVFGKENMTAANVIFQNLSTYDDWAAQIEKTNKANEQAAVNSNTLKNRIDEVKNAFINQMVSGDKLSPSMEKLKDRLVWVADNMDLIFTWAIRLISAFAIWKGIIIATQTYLAIYNVALGVTGALSGTASIAIGKNTIALTAYNVTTKLAAAATWLLNGALAILTSPITLIIIAIGLLVALVVVIIKKWDEWGAALSLFLGPLGLIISVIQSFRRNWDMVVKAFKTGGLIAGIKAIGRVLLDALLQPVQHLLQLLSKVPGMATLAGAGAQKINEMRQSLGVEGVEPLNSPAVKSQQITNEKITTTKNSVDINVNDPHNRTTIKGGSDKNPVKITKTNGQR